MSNACDQTLIYSPNLSGANKRDIFSEIFERGLLNWYSDADIPTGCVHFAMREAE